MADDIQDDVLDLEEEQSSSLKRVVRNIPWGFALILAVIILGYAYFFTEIPQEDLLPWVFSGGLILVAAYAWSKGENKEMYIDAKMAIALVLNEFQDIESARENFRIDFPEGEIKIIGAKSNPNPYQNQDRILYVDIPVCFAIKSWDSDLMTYYLAIVDPLRSSARVISVFPTKDNKPFKPEEKHYVHVYVPVEKLKGIKEVGDYRE